MKIGQTLKVIDKGWIRKPKGFRVHYQRQTDTQLETEFTPELDDPPLDSDVAAWRTAWKLQQATLEDNAEFGEGRVFNIYVVDDEGALVKYYKTNAFKVYNKFSGPDAHNKA